MLLTLSWRNLWRNPKRTLIILTAVVISAWTMLILSAFSRGMIDSTLSNSLNTLTGHIQIQAPLYREDPVVENRIPDIAPVKAVLERHLPPGSLWSSRIQVPGVASNARHSKGVGIVGIEPDREPDISFYGDTLSEGQFLKSRDDIGIVIGKALADTFETKPGRKLVLMTQGSDRETASRAFRIRGIFRAEMEATEKQYVFITLAAARELLRVDSAVTNICIKLPEPASLDRVTRAVSQDLPPELSVLPWTELLPLLKGYLEMFDSFMLLWYLVVFTAMAFGLVNTMLMAVLERTREFGLLKALGMKPVWIVRNVLTESFILLTVGIIVGNLLGFATVHAFSGGIDLSFLARGSEFVGMGNIVVPLLFLEDLFSANAVILVFGLLVCLYPAIKAGRITPVEAMTQN